jgi:hypothetical protein
MYEVLCIKNGAHFLLNLVKSKAVPLRHAEAKGKRKYSVWKFFTPALDGG